MSGVVVAVEVIASCACGKLRTIRFELGRSLVQLQLLRNLGDEIGDRRAMGADIGSY